MPFSWFKKSVDINPGQRLKDSDFFYVITAVFNPASFQARYNLYYKFANHMKATGAQLITIECIFPSLSQHEFQVTDSENPNHIQLKSDSIYWMKENLINIAVSRLPPHALWVCWLDSDIEFESEKWIELTIKELQKCTVVQMFKKAKFLGPCSKLLRTDYSFGYSVVKNKPIDQTRYDEWYPHPGYGWAMTVKDFVEIDGLPDYDIVGSGDLHFAFSLINKVSNALEDKLNSEFKQLILNRSNLTFYKLQKLCKVRAKEMVGYVPVNIRHNWHGSRKDRQYVDRWMILIAHDFNYSTDVTKTDDGLLQLNPNKSAMQRDIFQHFQMRNEDTTEIDVKEDQNETVKNKLNKGKEKYGMKGDKNKTGKPDKETKYEKDGKSVFKKKDFGTNNDFFTKLTRDQNRDNETMILVAVLPSMSTQDNRPRPTDDCYSGHQDNAQFCYENNYDGAVQCTTQY